MTKEEIIKEADHAIEMFDNCILSSTEHNDSIKCAILHYERIVERDEFWFQYMSEILENIAKHFKQSVSNVSSPALENSKAILQELHSRL